MNNITPPPKNPYLSPNDTTATNITNYHQYPKLLNMIKISL